MAFTDVAFWYEENLRGEDHVLLTARPLNPPKESEQCQKRSSLLYRLKIGRGRSRALRSALGSAKVNILAFLTVAVGAEGFVQLVVDDLKKAKNALGDGGFSYSEQEVLHLRTQLAEVMKRLEKQKNEIVEVQKIDPVLEVTLRASIENLTNRIEALEKGRLERWDVTLVLLQLLGAIGVILGVVLGIARYLIGK